MSIVPLLETIARELDRDSYNRFWYDDDHLLDDDFGVGIHPIDIFHRPRAAIALHPRRRYIPYERAHHALSKRRRDHKDRELAVGSDADAVPHVGKDGFQVCMSVAQFKPNELTVKTVDNTVIVEGKHEEREDDHGFIQRHFVRKYTLPKGYDPQEVVSTVSSDGILTVKAPPPHKGDNKKERIIQIQQTGPAHLNVKAIEKDKIASANGEGSVEKMDTNTTTATK